MLDALAAQEAPFPWDVLAIDSGSDDETWELLEERARDFPVPFRVRRIRGDEFDHGDTRNALAADSEGELLVFLTQDAIPSRPDWLATNALEFGRARPRGDEARAAPRAADRPGRGGRARGLAPRADVRCASCTSIRSAGTRTSS